MADDTAETPSDIDGTRTLLTRLPALQRPCDLDVLLFFARHWRSLLSSEQLARLLGYPLDEITRSRDGLVAAGLLTRVQDPTRGEGMYVFEGAQAKGGPVSDIVKRASTPGGRVLLRRALQAPTHATQQSGIDSGSGTRTSSRKGHSDD